jgi:hypothetical protein
MTDYKVKYNTDPAICRHLFSELKQHFNDGVPGIEKETVIEFRTEFVAPRNELTIYWILKSVTIDSVTLNKTLSSEWSLVVWETWARDVVSDWIDAYKHPMIDAVDLSSVQGFEEDPDCFKIQMPWRPDIDCSLRELNGGSVSVTGRNPLDNPNSKQDWLLYDYMKIERANKAREIADRMGIALASFTESLYRPKNAEEQERENGLRPKLESMKFIPTHWLGKPELNKAFSEALGVQTGVFLDVGNRRVEVTFRSNAFPKGWDRICFDEKEWSRTPPSVILADLKSHLSGVFEMLQAKIERKVDENDKH